MKNWIAVILIVVFAGLLLWYMGWQYISAQQAMAQAEDGLRSSTRSDWNTRMCDMVSAESDGEIKLEQEG